MTLKITLTDLIANFAIVIVPLFFASQHFKKHHHSDSIGKRLLTGVAAGLLGTILLVFTIQIDDAIIDFRQLAVILSAFFGGIYSSIITGVIICVMRLLLFPPITEASAIAAFNSIIVAAVVGVLSIKVTHYWRFWVSSMAVLVFTTGTVFIINRGYDGIYTASIYAITIFIGGSITAYILKFLLRAKETFTKLESEASFDFLTGLHNNRKFDSTFSQLADSARKNNERLTVALIDIDHFKKVNDTYGHVNGDVVLAQLAGILNDAVRAVDTVSRNGGEEFSVLMYNTTTTNSQLIAEKIRAAVESHKFQLNDGKLIHITVSIGIAAFPETELEALYSKADQALYQAKALGRNKVCTA